MPDRKITILRAVNRYGVLPSNFIYALDGGNRQNVKVTLQELREHGYLYCPSQQEARWNGLTAFKIYALTKKGADAIGEELIPWAERQFWHQLMIAQIVSSFELIACHRGLAFRTQGDILGNRPLSLPCAIAHEGEEWHGDLKPDAIFGIGDKVFVLEADRNHEPIWRSHFGTSSYRRKLLQYGTVFKERTYQAHWHVQSLFVLNVTTSPDHAKNITDFMEAELGAKSRAMCFLGIPILGSHRKSPWPLMTLLDDPWPRVGHPPLKLSEVLDGPETTAHQGTHRTQGAHGR